MSMDVAALAEQYWEARLEAGPLVASFLGDHRYDDRADDVSAVSEQRLRERWRELRDRVAALPADDLGEDDAVTRELLVDELDGEIRQISLRVNELPSHQIQSAHSRLLIVAGKLTAPAPEQAAMALTRVGELARMLDQTAQRYREGLANRRTPPRIVVTRSINQVDGYLSSPLDAAPPRAPGCRGGRHS